MTTDRSASHTNPTFVANSSRNNFALIANEALRDKRLSYRAKGILAACLTHSANFVFDKGWILEHGTEGRDAIVSALKELRSLGYLKNVKVRNAEGRICGERYEFSDRPRTAQPAQPAQLDQDTGVLENRTPENQRPGKPDAGFSGRLRRSIDRRPREENQETPPVSPRGRSKGIGLELPEWLEPHRAELERWQTQRGKAHPKLLPGISKVSLKGLLYAKELGVLQEFCDLASEATWQSLGFAGHREYIEKLVKDKNPNGSRSQVMAPIKYTLT